MGIEGSIRRISFGLLGVHGPWLSFPVSKEIHMRFQNVGESFDDFEDIFFEK
jgi:hypothetical protein